MLIQLPEKILKDYERDGLAVRIVKFVEGGCDWVINPNMTREQVERDNAYIETHEGEELFDTYSVILGELVVSEFILTFELTDRKVQIRHMIIGDTMSSKLFNQIVKKIKFEYPKTENVVLINQMRLERFHIHVERRTSKFV